MNNDNYNDIVLATEKKLDVTSVIINNGGKFDTTNRVIKLQSVEYTTTADIEIYDIDTDGDYDIVELKQLDNKSKIFVHINNSGVFNYVPNYIQNSDDGNWLNGNQSVGIGYQDQYGWSVFKIDDIDGDGIDDIIPENYHDGKYNGLKKINGIWKQHIFSFQKCKK